MTPVLTPEPHPEPPVPDETHRAAITEEVKALVSRLFREGKSPEEIAHTADLTTTEVNLILAVRDRKLENMVSELRQEESDWAPDQLFGAIASLREEGASSREIARKLEVSLSEVQLVSSLIALKHRGR